jgi:transcriptional regulator with XRE-family HTH domain
MINAIQIRAARALLDWSTSELANRAGMTVNAINRIERGHVNAQRSTLDKIEEIFESAGIEFLPSSGLRKRDKTITIYEGLDFRKKVVEDISNSLKQMHGELLVAHEDESLAAEDIGIEFLKRHLAKRKKAKIAHRFFVRSNDKGLIQPIHTYHVMPDKYFSPYPLYIYGSKLALSSRMYSPRAIIIANAQFAESIKKVFDYIWDNTLNVPTYRNLQKKKNKSDKLTGRNHR